MRTMPTGEKVGARRTSWLNQVDPLALPLACLPKAHFQVCSGGQALEALMSFNIIAWWFAVTLLADIFIVNITKNTHWTDIRSPCVSGKTSIAYVGQADQAVCGDHITQNVVLIRHQVLQDQNH